MRTTGLQVSGYNFLLRRLELALVIGDPRMAHDPLRSQRRALVMGCMAALLIAGAAAMLALLRPEPSLDGADLARDENGSYYVRLQDGYHPVTNVASARLIVGRPVEAEKATAEQLSEMPLGAPVGIALVPSLAQAPSREWAYCEPGVVVAFEAESPGPGRGELAADSSERPRAGILRAASGTWLVNGTQRSLVAADAPRALGVEPLEVSEGFVAQFDRRADSLVPAGPSGLPAPFDQSGRVILAGDRAFLTAPGGVAEVAGARRVLAEALSPAPALRASLSEVLAQPNARGGKALDGVPATRVEAWKRLCGGSVVIVTPAGLSGAQLQSGGPRRCTGRAPATPVVSPPPLLLRCHPRLRRALWGFGPHLPARDPGSGHGTRVCTGQ